MPRFSTKEFVFEDGFLRLYRRVGIEEIPFDEISTIELKKGSDLKRPKSAVTFGVFMLLLCIKMLGFYNLDIGEFFASGVVLRILSVLFFIGGIGVYSIYSALPIHPVVEILGNGQTERLSISSIIKSGLVATFSDFLQMKFSNKFKDRLNSKTSVQ